MEKQRKFEQKKQFAEERAHVLNYQQELKRKDEVDHTLEKSEY